jgi:methylmalonyl-CoA mutase
MMFAEFSDVSYEDWKKQAVKDLKGTDFEAIVWEKTFGKVLPYYTERPEYGDKILSDGSETQNLPMIECASGEEEKSNKLALAALNTGADGILFELRRNAKPDFATLLRGIGLNFCSVAFSNGSTESYFDFQNYLTENYADKTDEIRGFFDAPFDADHAEDYLKMPDFSPCVFRPVGQDETAIVAECIAFYADILRKNPDWASKIVFSFSAQDDFFCEIAKIRALKKLLLGMSQKAGVPFTNKIHVSTQPRSDEQAQKDPYLNMISNTTQAMSVVAAGADSLTVLPHTYGMKETDDFSARIARNVYCILREESFLTRVADATAGAYYVEQLTDKIARTAYEKAFSA